MRIRFNCIEEVDHIEGPQMIAAILVAQSATDLAPIAFDLGKVKTAPDGGSGTGGAIVVCARRRQPLPESLATGPYAAELPPKAEFGLFGKVRANLHGDQDRIGGIPSNAAKVKITVPF